MLFRFYTAELRFHLKKRQFLVHTEIVRALGATQFISAWLGAVFHWGCRRIATLRRQRGLGLISEPYHY